MLCAKLQLPEIRLVSHREQKVHVTFLVRCYVSTYTALSDSKSSFTMSNTKK